MAKKARKPRPARRPKARPAAARKGRRVAKARQARKRTRRAVAAASRRKPARRTTRAATRRSAARTAARRRVTRSAKPKTTAKARKKAPAAKTARTAARPKTPPSLQRERRKLPEDTRRSTRELDESRFLGASMTGREELVEKLLEHTETGPTLTGGDLDGNWEHAYSAGDEAPGGDNPTPDQGRVDDIGKALGVTYSDNEELRAGDKEADRDRHRWELDPASAEDYRDRIKGEE